MKQTQKETAWSLGTNATGIRLWALTQSQQSRGNITDWFHLTGEIGNKGWTRALGLSVPLCLVPWVQGEWGTFPIRDPNVRSDITLIGNEGWSEAVLLQPDHCLSYIHARTHSHTNTNILDVSKHSKTQTSFLGLNECKVKLHLKPSPHSTISCF